MRKGILLPVFLCIVFISHAQIRFSKMLGSNSSDYGVGYGAAIKFAHDISEAGALTIEGSVDIFFKKGSTHGWGVAPVKLGYRYSLNQSGYGFYVEPQAGYNFYGTTDDDKKFTGLAWGAGTGYLFEPWGKVQFNLGLSYQSALYSGGALNYVALTLTHNFSFAKKDDY